MSNIRIYITGGYQWLGVETMGQVYLIRCIGPIGHCVRA
jgi:hypothetical protein